jgi:hypothetical protein
MKTIKSILVGSLFALAFWAGWNVESHAANRKPLVIGSKGIQQQLQGGDALWNGTNPFGLMSGTFTSGDCLKSGGGTAISDAGTVCGGTSGGVSHTTVTFTNVPEVDILGLDFVHNTYVIYLQETVGVTSQPGKINLQFGYGAGPSWSTGSIYTNGVSHSLTFPGPYSGIVPLAQINNNGPGFDLEVDLSGEATVILGRFMSLFYETLGTFGATPGQVVNSARFTFTNNGALTNMSGTYTIYTFAR